jgi:predicted PurR-regulated permease PerM
MFAGGRVEVQVGGPSLNELKVRPSMTATSEDASRGEETRPDSRSTVADAATEGENAALADVIEAAEIEAAELPDGSQVLGTPGPPINRRSPFMIGLQGGLGIAVAYGMVLFVLGAANVLALIGISLFLAIGLEPPVAWLIRHRFRRGAAVALVSVVVLALIAGFLAAAIPPLIAQIESFGHQIPDYITQMKDHSTTLGKLDARFHIQQHVSDATRSFNASAVTGGLLSAGKFVLSTTVSILTVLVLTIYLLSDLPRIRRLAYRLVPARRRPRAILIGDEVQTKVGAFVLGNVITSLIAGIGTYVWLLAFGVPYPVVLSLLVALLDLVPIVGSTVAGIIVSLVALTVSLPVAIATAIFYTGYRLLEDYLLVPRIIGRTVKVPATVTFIAVLIGGTALGLIGALVAIPVAAAIDILLRETVFPRLDQP